VIIKVLFNIVICLIFFLPVSSQSPPSIQWQKCYGGSNSDVGYAVQQTSDGGYIVGGVSQSNDGDVSGHIGNNDYWVIKLDKDGTISWEKSIGSVYDDQLSSIQQTSDGGYIIAGASNSMSGNINGQFDYYIVKLKSNGSIEWQKFLGGSGNDKAYSVQQTTDGGYIVAGQSFSVNGDVSGNHGLSDAWVVKLNPAGNMVWQKSLGGSSYEVAWCIKQTNDGGYILTGSSSSVDGDVIGGWPHTIPWIVKLNSTGNILWQKEYGSKQISSAEVCYSIQQTSEGGYIVAGYNEANGGDVTGNHGSRDFWLLKLDDNGNLIWQKSLGGSKYETAQAVQETSDKGFIAVGTTDSNDGDVLGNSVTTGRYWVTKLSSLGILEWQQSYGLLNYGASAFGVQQTADKGYIVTGINGVSGSCPGSFSLGVIKLTSEIKIQDSSAYPKIYPNPAVNQIFVDLHSSEKVNATFRIFDAIGREVYRKIFLLNIGLNSIPINTSKFSTGVYILSITGKNNYSRKFVKIAN